MYRLILTHLLLWAFIVSANSQKVVDMSAMGIVPSGKKLASKMAVALRQIREEAQQDSVVIRFQPGRYDFYEEDASSRMYYISNHAEYLGGEKPLERPLRVALPLEDFHSLTLEGNGALFVCHGAMLPVSLVRSSHCTLQNFTVDFQETIYPQIRILKNERKQGGITFELFPEMDYRITGDSTLEVSALGRSDIRPFYATVYDGTSKRLAYQIGDIPFPNQALIARGKRVVQAPMWEEERLKPGMVLILRTWDRPAPAIFLHQNVNTVLKQVEINYAEGMGLLAQLCDNVTLDGFKVCLSERNPSRYISSIVDATHFSHCRGTILSTNGLYEHMGDDAINVHGIYLDLQERVDDHTVIGRFMYEQTYGFDWGFAGDSVQFIAKETSEVVAGTNRIARITPLTEEGSPAVRAFRIQFAEPLDSCIVGGGLCGLENLTWTPEVYFTHNLVRNNRARGSLFTTPRKVVVDSNTFDHVSGSAILISGDCSLWFESGACRDVQISRNRFVNTLSCLFMESNAVISITPLIKDLSRQTRCYHGGEAGSIRIIDNCFETFDNPILYAKSVDGLLFKGNTILTNTEYPPFHWNRSRFRLEHVGQVEIEP
ncbi:MAG: alpha-1,3-galactosidase B [Parabacteroides sp.]